MLYLVAALISFLFMVMLSSSSSAPFELPCSTSKMCSRGISKTYVGDIRNSSSFLDMLAKVSYTKEIMFVAAGPPPTGHDEKSHHARIGALDMPLQLADELYEMGYTHFLLVSSHSNRICEAASHIRPETSCVWDSLHLTKAGLGLLHYKIAFIARVVRAGFNVMALDADVIFFADPYYALKQTPVLRDANFICIPEGGSAYNCNAGFMYLQNADPSGPVAWVWFDIIRVLLRRADQGLRMCLSFDQLLISDSLLTSAAGLPVYVEAVKVCISESMIFKASNGKELVHPQVIKNMMALQLDRGNRTSILPSQSFMDEFSITSFNIDETEFFYGYLTVPNLRYGRGKEFGGLLYTDSAPLGPFASAWEQTLKSDNPDAPWFQEDLPLSEEEMKRYDSNFLDLSDHSKMAHVHTYPYYFHKPGAKQEMFAHSPHWLTMSIQASPKGLHLGKNISGKEGPKKKSGPYLSMGHIHGLATGTDKLIYRKILAKYNWTLGTEISKLVHWSPYTFGGHIDQVMALHPSIDLSYTRNFSEFSAVVMGLAQAARLSRRTLVLPTLPCETSWLDKGQRDKPGPGAPCVAPIPSGWRPETPIYFPVDSTGSIVGGWTRKQRKRKLLSSNPEDRTTISDPWWNEQKYRVIPGGFDRFCATDMHSIIAPEYDHWLKFTQRGREVAQVKPSPANMAFVVSSQSHGDFQLKSDPLSHGWSLADMQASISVTDAVRELKRFANESILFVAHPIMIHATEKVQEEEFIHVNNTLIDPNILLSHLNHKFTTSRCRWLKKRIDAIDPVDPVRGIRARIDLSGCIVKA